MQYTVHQEKWPLQNLHVQTVSLFYRILIVWCDIDKRKNLKSLK